MNTLRCSDCNLQKLLCICALLPRIKTKTQLLLVIHKKEVKRTSNTGLLAVRCLENSSYWVRGEEGKEALDFMTLANQGITNLLLYPSADTQPLTPEFLTTLKGPLRLIVPDGNWGQASRTASRIRSSLNPQTVTLPVAIQTNYRLRKELHKDGLATFEAIARAMTCLEGEDIEAQMTPVFRTLVERHLYLRGRLSREEVFGGIPNGA
jgi:DTW domain-containing protein YfiP